MEIDVIEAGALVGMFQGSFTIVEMWLGELGIVGESGEGAEHWEAR